MPLIPENILDEIQSRIDIAELIGHYVPLKRAGRHFKAACPFHKEKTPSFHINTEKQIFHCFGCGVGGNIFGFLMQHEKLNFPEAVKQLAERAGVTIPDSPDESKDKDRDKLLGVLEKTASYYEKLLMHPAEGKSARDYLKKRGLNQATRQLFRIGYAPGTGERLINAATRSQIDKKLLESAGLIFTSKKGLADRFRGRLIFPIIDVRGRILGFGGRSLEGREPKYLNSPETSLYSKGRNLFCLFYSKEDIAKSKTAIVVEGYFDCIVLYQAGTRNVVSPLGTAFTPEQAKLLARYAKKVILAFDSDAAGESATLRGIDILVETGLQVSVAELPPGLDPDDFVRAYGVKAFESLLEKASPLLEFLISCAKKKFGIKQAESRAQAAQFILPTISKVKDEILKAEYVRLLAGHLELDERAVAQELAKSPSRNTKASLSLGGASETIRSTEKWLVAFILDLPSRLKDLSKDFSLNQLGDERLRHIISVLQNLISNYGENVSGAQVISRLDAEEARLASELMQLAQSEPGKDEAFKSCIEKFKKELYRRQREQLQEQLQTAQRLGNQEQLDRLLSSLQDLDRLSHTQDKRTGLYRREKVVI